MPRFGWDTIRRFANKASEMKKLGARDFEDLLQCAIPAFEGLFEEERDNKLVLKLLFKMAEWHGFAKLRMHTDTTLDHLEELTRDLGRLVRQFHKEICCATTTYELPRETAARQRRATDRASRTDSASQSSSTARKKAKTLNLNTYKWHSMPDYVPHIRLFRSSDNFSTQLVSVFLLSLLFHTLIKY